MMHYVTSKGAVTAFTRALSRAVGQDGICVNTLAPGFTLSDSVVENNPGHVRARARTPIQRRAIKRDAHPPDLLGALVFLASADSDFITGQTHRGRWRSREYLIFHAVFAVAERPCPGR